MCREKGGLPHDFDLVIGPTADDDTKDGKKNLLFLKKLSESDYIKIAVDVLTTERYLRLPKVDTMFHLKIATEDEVGIEGYRQIMQLKKIR